MVGLCTVSTLEVVVGLCSLCDADLNTPQDVKLDLLWLLRHVTCTPHGSSFTDSVKACGLALQVSCDMSTTFVPLTIAVEQTYPAEPFFRQAIGSLSVLANRSQALMTDQASPVMLFASIFTSCNCRLRGC
jgi:hypothetical protein